MDLERRYKFNDIEYAKSEVDTLKKEFTIDDYLSSNSTNPVENRIIVQALNGKVNKESNKGLSSNDFTDEEKSKLANMEENIIESISVNGTPQTITDKNVDIKITDKFTDEYQHKVDENTSARHTHDNKAILDTYTISLEDLLITSATHTHSNKAILDTYTKTESELIETITQGNEITTVTGTNGMATKFPDGTLICYGLIQFEAIFKSWGNGYSYDHNVTIGFPATFIEKPVVTATNVGAPAAAIIRCEYTATAINNIALFRTNISDTGYTVSYTAIGRWK